MRELWSNTRERIPGNEKREGEDGSCTKGIEILLRETAAKKVYPDLQDVDNPMTAPQDY